MTATAILTKEQYHAIAWLHVYGQDGPHDDLLIRGTRNGLLALRDALSKAIESRDGEGEAVAGDGEGYRIITQRVNVVNFLGHVPYQGREWWTR